MLQEERRLNCERHPYQGLSLIYIGNNPSIKSRFLCIDCIHQRGDQYKTKGLSQLIKIEDFFTNPGMQYRKTISNDINAYIQEINKCIQQLVIFFQKFYESIQTHLEQLQQNLKQLKLISATINQDIENQSNFKESRKLFQTIKIMDCFQGTQEFKKIQMDINSFCKNFNQFYNNALIQIKTINHLKQIYRQEQSLIDCKQSLINIQKDLTQMSSINIYTNYEINLFNRENSNDFSFVLLNICKGNLKYDLIYQGTKDGLTTSNYLQKCDQQSHLLTIITLKNGNVFGGYSPCQLNKGLNNYVIDNTNTSFLFQQNKQQIYKLIKKEYAIVCRNNYGPTFGGGYDLHISNDFKQLGSNLGHSYDVTGFNVQNYKTHLFGDKDTGIMECKVYKISYFL